MIKKILITGSLGLVGFESTKFFLNLGHKVYGVDNDSRSLFFGKEASTKKILEELKNYKNYNHFFYSINNKNKIKNIISSIRPNLIIHCAAQPSHDRSSIDPILDFNINSLATLNLLELVRINCPDCIFIFVSTNKVYGDNPNKINITEKENRFEINDNDYLFGIDEKMSIDNCLHSPFGVSKASADLLVQEYGKYYGIQTVCFRCGCITGPAHRGVELHGFLSYLCKSIKSNNYIIYGYKGKQVRDNIDSYDLVMAFFEFYKNPKIGEVYNIGGGIYNSCSILEAIDMIDQISGHRINFAISESIRKGDHKCYYTDFSKFKKDYPNWKITINLSKILEKLIKKNEKTNN